MLERESWGSGQIARPGYPPKHSGGEFSWAHELLGVLKRPFWRLETYAKRGIDRLRAGRLIGVQTTGPEL